MPGQLDPTAVRKWCACALAALEGQRAEIDAINVYPVADGDTGSNLCLTLEAADRALRDGPQDTAAGALRAMAHGALLGACGNSGTILAQLLQGIAEVYAEAPPGADGGGAPRTEAALLRRALRRAADAAYAAVAHPVEGTMLTVADAAAEAAGAAYEAGTADAADVALAAHAGARTALAATPRQLDVLARAGVVDAGGSGLVAVLGGLAEALGAAPPPAPDHGRRAGSRPVPRDEGQRAQPSGAPGPAFEVMYLLDADDAVIPALRTALDRLGDSLVIVGGDGLWNVHVHADDAGAAIEAGIERGRPHRVRITPLAAECPVAAEPPSRVVVAVVHGDGLAALCADAGATVVRAVEGEPGEEALAEAIQGTGGREVVLLPNDPELQHAAVRAAERTRTAGIRTAVIPTRAAVQGIAALAVHAPDRRFDEDVVAMTSAAGATRYGEVTVAERQSWTMAGVCQAGDVLGLVEGDVAVIGSDIDRVALDVLERMLAAGGELVTLVVGADAPEGLAEALRARVRRGYLAVDTVVHEGRQQTAPLLIGVE